MFVYDNGKVCILTATRCGHTSMYQYFGIEPYTINVRLQKFTNSFSKRVIVLRDPMERVYSAYKLLRKIDLSKHIMEPEFFVDHSRPYLSQFEYVEFSYIRFDRLSEYIGSPSSRTIKTNAVLNSRNFYITNYAYTEDELQNECLLYNTFLTTRPELSPEEWKELVG